MKCLHRLGYSVLGSVGAIALSTLGIVGFGGAIAPAAHAQPAYGSYVGIGGSIGLSEGGVDEGNSSGGVIAVRYRLLEIPLSLRTQVLLSERTAIVPTVSYDIPITWELEGYLGAGVAFPLGGSGSDTSPVGNETSFVLQPGLDYTLPNSDLVIFSNAIIAFDAYEQSNNTAVSVQAGVGLQF